MKLPSPPRSRTGKCFGFSLMELLISIAIVALLAALILPTTAKMRQAALSAGCVSNLHTLGNAILLYASDHDNTLPGPMFPSFGETYGQATATNGYLSDYLWPYLELPVPLPANNWLGHARQPFVCPAYYQKFGSTSVGRNGSYTTQTSLFRDGVETKHSGPFGLISTTVNPPVKLSTISAADMQNKNFFALSDLDSAPDAQGRTLGGSTLVKSPIHGTYRNQLFFDMHVERVPFP
jgi:prepilin-type N-terminal cleavage/methylation domain-containing protein